LLSLSFGGLLKRKATSCAISLKLCFGTPLILWVSCESQDKQRLFFLKEIGKSEAIIWEKGRWLDSDIKVCFRDKRYWCF